MKNRMISYKLVIPIVLKDIQFDEMAGEQRLKKFIISAVSDQDFYADLTEREKTLKTLL